jgi:NhaA family Na+:H+ antiporter
MSTSTRLGRFLRVEANSTALLLLAAVAAMLWANSSLGASYRLVWQTPVALGPVPWLGAQPVRFWVNDVLMTFFFLVVGLEIRSELHDGILSDRRVAALPLIAAVGGIVFPAILFVLLNPDALLRRGWAIPTATDIAFAVGVLMLLRKRVPRTLRVLLLTLAIVDDIAAVLVIALYYSKGFFLPGLLIAVGAIVIVLTFQRCGLRRALWYLLPGALLWYGLARAGIEPTLAGVILGLMTPVLNEQNRADMPLVRVRDALHPWVAFGVMPLFALANAGVELRSLFPMATSIYSVGAGVVLGLVLGKPLGIFIAATLCSRLGLCTLPGDIGPRHLLVLGCLGGIGFTMSMFLADLAFSDADLVMVARAAVLLGSLASAGSGLLLGRMVLAPARASELPTDPGR